MSQEIEIEFKNILTKEEFIQLKTHFTLHNSDFSLQENHYFDTPLFSLKNHGAALRIRQKQDNYVLTLKEPADIGLLETHQFLSNEEAKYMMKTGLILDGPVKDQLVSLGIAPDQLTYFGSLVTDRAEKKVEEGLIVLDHSRYLSVEDYEVEFEVKEEEAGKQAFLKILKELSIPIRPTKNKIRRFYDQKYHSEKS
ncbi:CYTH domain-containing protein [Metabacillus herbersteinensis]|uniref:CYTH domain-containing protein n=1 Tax=Metabacillus herbersteinensis TaxID=283816 RepID=A0ABV6GES0_9BACI